MRSTWLQRKIEEFDWSLLLLSLLLLAVGLIAMYSASGQSEGAQRINFQKQVIWGGLGIGALWSIYLLKKKVIYEWSYILYGVLLIILTLTLFFGTGAGSSRWIEVGPISIQPSEFMKIALVLALAKYLSRHRLNLQQPASLIIPFLLAIIPAALVFKQPDLGTAMVFPAILFPMLYWANVPLFYLFFILAPVISVLTAFNFATFAIWIGVVILILYFSKRTLFISVGHFLLNVSLGLVTPILWESLKDYQQTRILTLFDMSLDPQGSGYQVLQSQTAIGSGGLWGRGIGEGTQTHLKFLPEQHTDFIFSVVGEEMGFIIVALVLVTFALFFLRMTYLGLQAKDRFSGLIIIGGVSMLFFHVVVNIAMTVGLMPVTGLPLPFFSYGGSFLLMTFVMLGLILNSNSEYVD